MKKTILSVAIFAAIGFTSCNSQQKGKASKTSEKAEQLAINNVTFGVRGNCGMCKSTIEKAANSLAGVSTAVWDVDQKKIAVSFDASKTTEMDIHNAIAASGYDTETAKGSETAYANLPGCCQYDHSMEMNQTREVKAEDTNH